LLALLVLVWRPVVVAGDAIVAGDLFVPLRREALWATFAPFWNPLLEFPNVETIDRAAFVLPSLLLGEPAAVQRAWLLASVFGAGLAMYVAARWLGAGPPTAAIVALAYGANPWVAMRLQHVFLLQAYAVLPLVVAWWWRPPGRWKVVGLVLLLSLGSTTPHGAAALWLASGAALLARPQWPALREALVVAGWYVAVNLYWLVPVPAFMSTVGLVPSSVTWEMLETFSRSSGLAAVLRLEGYWWPLGPLPEPGWRGLAGVALATAALLAWLRPRREVAVVTLSALALSLVALGTRLPWLIGWLALDGPLADRVGWLVRDPNKVVGALAALLLLAVALVPGPSRPGRLPVARLAAGLLVSTYLAFALPRVIAYVDAAYPAEAPPQSLHATFDWLAERGGRAIWLPGYFGARTFWNPSQPTPEVLSLSSPVPVLSPYGYDARAVRAFLGFDRGAVLGDLAGDTAGLAQRWHLRWLVHHRDVLPARLQPPGTGDGRVVARSLALLDHDLPVALAADPFTVHDLGPLPPPHAEVETAALTQRPIAATIAVSAVADALDLALVEDDHPGVRHVVALPGDDVRLLFVAGAAAVDLPAVAPHAAPAERWSRYDEGAPAWWPNLAGRHGPAALGTTGIVATSRPGARLATTLRLEPGHYRLVVRGYEGPAAGVVDVALDADDVRRLDLERPVAGMAWHDLGAVTIAAPQRLTIELRNRHGSNALGDVTFVPQAALDEAAERLAGLDVTWLWPVPEACRPLPADAREAPGEATPPEPIPLPLDLPWPGSHGWHEISYLELVIEGSGVEQDVEAWTSVDGVWVLLGQARVWWRGLRTVLLPVEASAFFAAPGGAAVAARLLRLLPSASPPEGTALRLHRARLVVDPPCDLRVAVHAPGELTLTLPGHEAQVVSTATIGSEGRRPIGELDGVAVSAGDVVRVDVEGGVPVGVPSLMLRRSAAGPPESTPLDGGAAVTGETCSPTWRLVRTDTRYVDGMRGSVAGERVEVVAVDGLMAGAWLPPGLCGALTLHNPWIGLGRWTALLSGVGALALAGTVLASARTGRRPARRRG
jgi:hypothetical protein